MAGEYVTIDGVLYKRVGAVSAVLDGHDERTCQWRKVANTDTWRCTHDVVVTGHPNGYCDQGCCR